MKPDYFGIAADLARETFARGIQKQVAAPADVPSAMPPTREKRLAGDVEDRPAPIVELSREQVNRDDGLCVAEVTGLSRGPGTEADRIREQLVEATTALALAVPGADVERWATSGSDTMLLWYRR